MLGEMIERALGWLYRERPSASAVHRSLLRPALEPLEDRYTPANFLWDPATGIGANLNWSKPRNWDILGADNQYHWQSTLTPGNGDTAVFDGSKYNNDCYQDVASGVTVMNMQVISGFSKSIILSNPLTIAGTSTPSILSLNSGKAALRGSAVGEPAARGMLNLAGNSTLAWNAGIIDNLDVYVTRTDTTAATLAVSNSAFGPREMSSTDIHLNGLLHWYSGDVNVSNAAANSTIYIYPDGDFEIEAAGATWGMGAVGDSYFTIYNNGLVRLNAPGAVHLVADYTTYATTRLDLGILVLAGSAEQWDGEFALRNNTTVEPSGPDQTLQIHEGEINGQGRVDGNLALGYDPNLYPDVGYSLATVMPGYFTTDPETEESTYHPGTLTVTQSFDMFTLGTGVDSWATSAGYGQLVVGGSAALYMGTLTVHVDETYHPAAGTYTLVAAGSRPDPDNNQFIGVNMPAGDNDPDNPMSYELQYNGANVDFVVEPVP
jgi:hypothetical protein